MISIQAPFRLLYADVVALSCITILLYTSCICYVESSFHYWRCLDRINFGLGYLGLGLGRATENVLYIRVSLCIYSIIFMSVSACEVSHKSRMFIIGGYLSDHVEIFMIIRHVAQKRGRQDRTTHV